MKVVKLLIASVFYNADARCGFRVCIHQDKCLYKMMCNFKLVALQNVNFEFTVSPKGLIQAIKTQLVDCSKVNHQLFCLLDSKDTGNIFGF